MRTFETKIQELKTSVLTEAVDYCRDVMEEFSYCMNISGIVGMPEIKNSEKYLVSAAVMLAKLFEHCKNPIPEYVGYTFQRTAQILQDRVSEENRIEIMELYRRTMEKMENRKLDPECIEAEICILEIALGITLEMEEEPILNRQVAEMIEERLRTVL